MEHGWPVHPLIKVYTVLPVIFVLPILVCSRECLSAPQDSCMIKGTTSLMTAPHDPQAYMMPSASMPCRRHSHVAVA